jgi:tetratricopeptide (TPR) repeat protein
MAKRLRHLLVLCALLHAATVAATPSEDEALRLSQHGAALFRAGKFREAAALLRQSYATYPAPILLYNLGRALDSAGELTEAIDAYKRYLEAQRNATDRGAVAARIATLEQQIHDREERERQLAEQRRSAEAREQQLRLEQQQELLAASVRAPPPPPPSRARRAAPWVLFGVGAAVAVTGSALSGIAISRQHAALDDSNDAVATRAQLDAARAYGISATATLAAGGVVAASGLIWGIVEAVRSRHTRVHASLARGVQ